MGIFARQRPAGHSRRFSLLAGQFPGSRMRRNGDRGPAAGGRPGSSDVMAGPCPAGRARGAGVRSGGVPPAGGR